MPLIVDHPKRIQAAGTRPKIIEEFFGMPSNGTSAVSIARMVSPEGWEEPGQRPEFDEYTVVLKGTLVVESENEKRLLTEGKAVHCKKNVWVRYSTPYAGGAEYIAVCIPAFSPETVHRDS